MTAVSTTVSTHIAVRRSAVFDWFIPVELPRIFLKHGPIPAVARVTGQTGTWDIPGSSRTVHLADGHTAQESVTGCEKPAYFSYRVSDIDNFLGRLAVDARGQWWFTDASRDTTDVQWTYTFNARNRLAALALWPIIKVFWRGYMHQAIKRVSHLATAEAK
jgi:hypothetical protein